MPFFSTVLSLLVVRLTSLELWGQFVAIMIVVNLALHLLQWGSKEYLLREFSRRPRQISLTWQSNVLTRFPLFLLLSAALFLWPEGAGRRLWVGLWGLGALFHQSCEALIIYRKRFWFALFVDALLSLLLCAVIVVEKQQINLDLLLGGFAAVSLLRAAAFLWRFRGDLLPSFAAQWQPLFYRVALPFLLLGLSGMLQSRTDIYCVTYFLSADEVGAYQVFINMALFVQALAAFVLQPFLKHLYRMPPDSLRRLSLRLFWTGAAVGLPAMFVIHIFLMAAYQISLPWVMFLWGVLFIWPIYHYLPTIYLLYRRERQSVVLLINVLGVLTNLLLNIVLIPLLDLTGAILASAVTQWLILAAYEFYRRQPDFRLFFQKREL